MIIADKKIIGRVEQVSFPELSVIDLHARIDTGAQTSAIWASQVTVTDGRLEVVFMGDGSDAYTGQVHLFDEYSRAVVASSNGQSEVRYKVKLLVQLQGKKIRATFTIADRSTQVYPVLIGRNILRGKFVVDVKHGKPLRTAEQERSDTLQAQIKGGKE